MGKKAVIGVVVTAAVVVIAAIALISLYKSTLRVEDVLAVYQSEGNFAGVTISYPGDGTLFPPEIVPPTFWWTDANPKCTAWLVRIELGNGRPAMGFLTREPRWTPLPQDWETIKKGSLEQDARVAILGVAADAPPKILTGARLSFRTSKDEVGRPAVLPRGEPALHRRGQGPVADPLAFRVDLLAAAAADRPAEPAGLRQLPLVQPGRQRAGDGRGLRQQQGLVRDHAGPAAR